MYRRYKAEVESREKAANNHSTSATTADSEMATRKRSGSISEDITDHGNMAQNVGEGVQLIKDSLEGACDATDVHVFVVMGASVSLMYLCKLRLIDYA